MNYTIVGGGIAACFALKEIKNYDPDSHVTVISAEEHCFYYRPMTPLVIKGDKERDEILYDDHIPEYHMIHGQAASLNTATREITLKNGETVSFDRLLIATGSAPEVPGLAGIHENTVFLGSGACRYQKQITAFLGDAALILPPYAGIPKASTVAHLARQRYLQDARNELYSIAPVYVRPPDAERYADKKVSLQPAIIHERAEKPKQ